MLMNYMNEYELTFMLMNSLYYHTDIQGRTPVAYRKMGISSLKSLTLFRVISVYEMVILHALAIALPNEQTLSLDH